MLCPSAVRMLSDCCQLSCSASSKSDLAPFGTSMNCCTQLTSGMTRGRRRPASFAGFGVPNRIRAPSQVRVNSPAVPIAAMIVRWISVPSLQSAW